MGGRHGDVGNVESNGGDEEGQSSTSRHLLPAFLIHLAGGEKVGWLVGVVLKDLRGARLDIRKKWSVWRLAGLLRRLKSSSRLLGGVDSVGGACWV